MGISLTPKLIGEGGGRGKGGREDKGG